MRTIRNIVPFIDVLFTLLMVFVIITILLKSHSENQDESFQQKNAIYLIVMDWKGNSDMDLWVKDSQNHLVCFKRREGGQGSLFSLNRDCLGAATTEVGPDGQPVNPVNEEIVTLRGIYVGEYVVNLHAYDMKQSEPVEVTVKLIQNKPYRVITQKTKTISTTGTEETFFRFTITQNKDVVDINDLPMSLTQLQDVQ